MSTRFVPSVKDNSVQSELLHPVEETFRVPLVPALTGAEAPLGIPTDEDLLARVRAGNVAALGDLYDRHRPLVFTLALRLLHDRTLAEDAIHEAFISVWRHAASFDLARGGVRGWICAVLRNHCLDVLRRVELGRTREALSTWHRGETETPDVGDLVARSQQAEELHQALARLPEGQRDAVCLAFFFGLSHTQIAARLDLPVGTVKGRVRLALAKLSQLLASSMA